MGKLIGYAAVLVVLAIAVIGMVMRGRKRRLALRGASQAEPQSDDTAATGYVPGVWMLGGAESAAPGRHAHGPHHGDAGGSHGVEAGGSHGVDAGGGTGDSGGSDGGGGH